MPGSYQHILQMIVASDAPRMKNMIDQCIAASFRLRNSMDRTPKDNKMMLMQLIKNDRFDSLMFVSLRFV